ncbi:MAG: DUF1343 domain-containing protein [Ignavibacteriaceae bacterium]|nr:DUF1343 domain-containing protein [Ignavibacteriaceae bacterium]
MKIRIILTTLISLLWLPVITPQTLQTGADVFLSEIPQLVANKRLGVVTNHTALVGGKVHIVDTLHKILSITTLFGPEHGIRGDAPAGDHIDDSRDPRTGIPVYSLYGKHRKPTAEMLRNVDILLFDIQDVGARFYTYISTLYHCVESASENNLPLIVLDRPNPLGGELVEGPIIKKEFYSFVGITELPIVHGMTVGELALYFNDIIKEKSGRSAEIRVIKMKGWSRGKPFVEYGLDFVKPSPNLADINSILVYPGTCLLEATNVSEGRGTETPFSVYGAPFINPEELIHQLELKGTVGVELKPAEFIPGDIPGMAVNPKHEGQKCFGVKMRVTDPVTFRPVRFGLLLLSTLNQLYPGKFSITRDRFNRLCGDNNIYELITSNASAEKIFNSSDTGIQEFKEKRIKYLLY